MAVTGKTSIPLQPAKRKVGALVMKLQESQSQTYPAGALLAKSAGLLKLAATSYISGSIYGIAISSGKNGSANGVKTSPFYRIERDALYKVVLTGTCGTGQLGSTLALSMNTAGVVVGVTDATASDSSIAYLVDYADGFTSADTNPVVYFAFVGSKITEG